MSEETQEIEDIIEDITEEQLSTNEELEQDTPEEVSEKVEAQEASFDDSIKSILLGEKKAVKKEDEDEDEVEEDEDEEEMEESTESESEEVVIEAKSKKEMAHGKKKEDEKEEGAHEDEDEEEDEEIEEGYHSKKKKKEEGAHEDEDEEEVEEGAHEDEEEEETKEAKAKKVSEALDTLLQNESSLTEEFKSEAATLFEATIAERSIEIQERLEEKYNSDLNEEVETIRESLIERIDDYLSYVVESWMEENTQQVENTLRTEIAENFMTSLKDVFVENYIDVPEEKQDLVVELTTVSEETAEKLETAESEIASLQEKVQEFERAAVISELSEDLSETESHKLESILEGVEFGSKESFAKKASVVKDSIFEGKEETKEEEETLEEGSSEDTEIIIEGEEETKKVVPAHMKAYVDALSKL
jgi:hypothetical protein